MKTLLTIILTVACVTNLAAQTRVYNTEGGEKILTQKSGLLISKVPIAIASDKEAAGITSATIIGPLIDIGVNYAKEKIKQNAKKFESTFSVRASESGFWKDEKNIRLPKLKIWKKVLLKGETKYRSALEIALVPALSEDKQAFRYAIESVVCHYSGAKTKGQYDYVELKLDVTFRSLMLNDSKYEVKDLRGFSITIPGIKTDGSTNSFSGDEAIYSAWLPLVQKPTITLETDKTTRETTTTKSTGTKEGKPVNDELVTETKVLKEKTSDTQKLEAEAGTYEFEVSVTETNPYKIKADQIDQQVEKTSDSITSLLKAIFAADKKEDGDKKE